MKRSTFNRHRLFAGLFLLVILFCGANYYLELGFFGRGAKGALILAMAVGVTYGGFFAPTRQDMREHRDASKDTSN